MSQGIVYLMYHELELPGRPMCQDEPGYVRYIVSASNFTAQMNSLKQEGRRGTSVSQALAHPGDAGVVITFDDGCETDLLTAAPLLHELGFSATFYVTVGFLDTRGYLSRAQLKELSDMAFEIGSHSLSHPYLTDLNDNQLAHELTSSREELERITRSPILHFSCPGGRWDRRVAAFAKRAGYQSVATSQFITNERESDPFALGRVAIMRSTGLTSFEALSKGHGLWKLRLKDSARTGARKFLGNALYDRLRARALAEQSKNG